MNTLNHNLRLSFVKAPETQSQEGDPANLAYRQRLKQENGDKCYSTKAAAVYCRGVYG